jgi:CHAT domain-containing protein
MGEASMFLDPTGTISVSLPPGWAFDPLSSSLSELIFVNWLQPNRQQLFVRILPAHAPAGAGDDDWEAAVRRHLPREAPRAERRDGSIMLVEVPGRDGRPAQRWAIVRGPRRDAVLEQVGVPLGGALLTPELAEALRTLSIPANRHLHPLHPQSAFTAAMQAANDAFHRNDVALAARGLARARVIARETWLHSLVGRPIPEVPAAMAEAEAALALAKVSGSAAFLQQATLTLYRCRAALSRMSAPSVPALKKRLEELLVDALAEHGARAKDPPPGNPFAACLMRCRLLMDEAKAVLQGDQPKIGGPWATLALEDAMTAVAYAGRGLVKTVPPDFAATLSKQGITDEAAQREAANRVFLVTALENMVAAGGLLHAARAQAALQAERGASANWLLAARRLAELSPSPARDSGVALALSSHAGALFALGDEPSLEEAGQLLDEAQGILDRLGDEDEMRAQICLNQAWLRHTQRRDEGGIAIADRAIAAAARAGAARIERAARSLRSQFLGIAGRHAEAADEARRALAATHDDAASTHQLNLAVVLHRAGDSDGALEALRAGLAAAAHDEPIGQDVVRLLFVVAAVLDPRDARRSLAATEAAEAMLDALRVRLGDAADRVGFDDADRHREVAATLVQRRLALGDVLGALATADRHRARSLTRVSRGGVEEEAAAGAPPAPPPTDAPLDAQVAFAVAAARSALGRAGVPPPLDGTALADLVADAGRTAVMFHPSGQALLIFVVRPGNPVTIGTVTAAASVAEVLALTDALRAQLGIVVAARAARGEVPVQSIEDLAAALADDAVEAADAELDRLRRALHDALFADVLPMLHEGEPVVVVPYRELSVIPLAVLAGKDGRPLSERHPLSVLPSLASLRALAHAAGPEMRAVVVGDPIVEPSHGLGPLPGAAAEASRVTRALQDKGIATTPLFREAATEAAFRTHAQGARILHLACHAAVRQKASASPLFLTPAPPEDGLLLPDEIADMRLDGALVVLAACQSGLGRATADGVLGLGRAFIEAGARAVVLSLWRVSDVATAALMSTFYDALVGKLPDGPFDVAGAVRYAQNATRAAISAHPSVWGPWLVVGDGGWRLA